jgi:hypothetical protein
MKTTIDIADGLLMKTRQVARREHVTLRHLVEEGLSTIVANHSVPRVVEVNPVIFKGEGMAPEFRQAGWPAIRDALHGGRVA